MAKHIHWGGPELEALARETAAGLHEQKLGSVPSRNGNTPFLKPIVAAAQLRALPPERRRPLAPNLAGTVKGFWDMVPKYLKELREPVNGHAEPAPAPPPLPPPPDPVKILQEAPDGLFWPILAERLMKALSTRQEIVVKIPGVDELREVLAETKRQLQATQDLASRLQSENSELKTLYLSLKMDVSKLRPPPPQIFVLGAAPDTVLFLRRKCDEAHLEVDFRFENLGATPKPFKADYVLVFGSSSNDWEHQISMAVPKSKRAFIGGRHDQAMVQIREWLVR